MSLFLISSTMLSHQAIVTRLVLVESLKETSGGSLGLASLSLLGTLVLLDESSVVGVKTEQNLLVAERVLLLDGSALGQGGTLGGVEDALDFGAVDQTGKVGVGNNVGGDQEVLLELRGLGGGAVDVVEGLEGSRGPDDEAAEVTTRGELEEVQGVDVAGLDTGQVAETLDELLAIDGGVVDDKGTAALAVAAATELALTGAELLGALGLQDILGGTDGGQDLVGGSGLGGLGTLESGRVNDQGNLGNTRDGVTTGQQKGSDSRGGDSRGNSEASLSLGDADVPSSPDLGRSEHWRKHGQPNCLETMRADRQLAGK
jgi:hypothetical protein